MVVDDGYSCDVGKNGDNGGDRGGVIRDSDGYYRDNVIDNGVSVGDNNDSNSINGTSDEK